MINVYVEWLMAMLVVSLNKI